MTRSVHDCMSVGQSYVSVHHCCLCVNRLVCQIREVRIRHLPLQCIPCYRCDNKHQAIVGFESRIITHPKLVEHVYIRGLLQNVNIFIFLSMKNNMRATHKPRRCASRTSPWLHIGSRYGALQGEHLGNPRFRRYQPHSPHRQQWPPIPHHSRESVPCCSHLRRYTYHAVQSTWSAYC